MDDAPRRDRICGDCTACCEGWLSGEAYGHKFYPGMPCHYLGVGRCSIYKDRPNEPCKSYRCQWLDNAEYPEWLRPDRSGVLFTYREQNGVEWIEARETGKGMTVQALNWIIFNLITKNRNVHYQIDGGWNYVGKTDFCAVMAGG